MIFESTSLNENVSFGAQSASSIAETGEKNGSILVLPIGSVEQHGDHLPVMTDTLLANTVATESAERVSNEIPVVVAPPFWSGYSPHHLSLGGTFTGEFGTLLDLLCDVAGTGLENGFDALMLVNGHGGNTPLINAAVSEIGSAYPEVEVLGLTYFELIADLVETIRQSGVGGMAHGGEFETSLMMYLYPELVDTDSMSATYWDEHYELSGDDLVVGGPVSVYRPFEQYSETGAIGAPDVANADTGEQLFDGVTETLGTLLVEAHHKNAGATNNDEQ